MNIQVSFSVTPQQFPPGTSGGMYHVQILGADGVTPITGAQAGSPGVAVTFPNLSAGDYVAVAKRFDGAGNVVLGSASQNFTLNAPATVAIDIPSSLSIQTV
jgi:hypothetical protein